MHAPPWLRATVVGALFLAGTELALRAADRFDPTEVLDPYMGFAGTSPVYRADKGPDGEEVLSTSPNKTAYREVSFPRAKEPGELRVFVLGGSSIYGPHGSPATIPAMLEIWLQAHDLERRARVINAGGRGTGSLQNLEVAREIVKYEPDVVLLYPEGGEKNLIPPQPGGVFAQRDEESPLRVEARKWLAPMRTYVAMREAIHWMLPEQPEAQFRSAFSAIAGYALSQPFSESTFTRVFEFKDDRVPVLMPQVIPEDVIDHSNRRFERCLRETVELCRERDIPVALVLPLHNLESSFYLRFHIDPAEIVGGDTEEWRRRYEHGLALKREGRCQEALPVLQSIRELYVEDRDEILAFDIAECWKALGEPEKQLAELTMMYERREMIRRIRSVAAELRVPLIEPLDDLVAEAGGRLPGYDYFEDSYHPLPITNAVIARTMLRGMVEMGVVQELAPDDVRRRAAQRRVDKLVQSVPTSVVIEITRAMFRRDYDEAARLARTIPPERMTADFVMAFSAGWALTRSGAMDEARKIHEGLLQFWGDATADLPDMSTDAGLVVHAFQGDVFAAF